MSSWTSTRSRNRPFLLAASILALVLLVPEEAWAQACCAGSGALTPGRLALHEEALVGTVLHAGTILGSYDTHGHFSGTSSGQDELDFEEDLFGAVRLLKRGQVALLIPFYETWRREPVFGSTPQSAFGGGIGDVNLSARYDFLRAAESRYVPGIAALAGITAPTGRAPSSSSAGTFAVDATGIGAWQGNFGIAVEQSFGPWLFDLSEILALRAPFSAQGVDEALAPQWSTLAGAAYVFKSESALALFASYTFEGSASINGATQAESGHRVLLLSLSGYFPVREYLRLQPSFFIDPPISGLGAGQTSTLGLTFTVIWSWT